MADFTFLPAAGENQTGAYPAVLGQPSVDGPIIYPAPQPDEPENVVPFTRETGLDPSKIPSISDILTPKSAPSLRVVSGGQSAPVAPAVDEKTGSVPAGAMVVASQAQPANLRVGLAQQPPAMTTQTTPAPNPDDKSDGVKLPWWGLAVLAGAALAVGYSLAKRRDNADTPLVADMSDEEGED